jgi:AcrR family transcriptional regulator
MPVTARAIARPGPRPAYSRHKIVDCALRLMDREGPEALTFRAVARELGITVGALSRYFRNVADLRDEVAAEVLRAVKPVPPGSRRDLRERMADFGMDIFTVTKTHPYLAEIHGPASAAVIARTMSQCVRTMQDAGIDLRRALLVYSVVSNLAQAWGTRNAVKRGAAERDAIHAVIAAELGTLAPGAEKLLSPSLFAAERDWVLAVIEGLLP